MTTRLTSYLKSRLYQVRERLAIDQVYRAAEFHFKLWKDRRARESPNQQGGHWPQVPRFARLRSFGFLSPIAATPRWNSGAITTVELAADHYSLRSFFATESAFLAVPFGFNLLGEFQRAIVRSGAQDLQTTCDPPFRVFTCGAILGRSGHHLVLHMSTSWGGYIWLGF